MTRDLVVVRLLAEVGYGADAARRYVYFVDAGLDLAHDADPLLARLLIAEQLDDIQCIQANEARE